MGGKAVDQLAYVLRGRFQLGDEERELRVHGREF
jgi:hypothetical protein